MKLVFIPCEVTMTISKLTVENAINDCITDNPNPRFSFRLSSEKKNTTLQKAELRLGDWTFTTDEQILVPYSGKPLAPFTKYTVSVTATDSNGERASATADFETGRMDTPWTGKWISDGKYVFKEKGVSPLPITFRKRVTCSKPIKRAKLYITAMGIYRISLNGERIGKDYFTPGFTSYNHDLQYQVYDVTESLKKENEFIAVLGGGWAVGTFVFTRKNRISADRQALLAELRIEYEDGSEEIVGTDESWEVTEEGNYRFSDLYDGETYDATVNLNKLVWGKAAAETLRISPRITAGYGAPVRAHEQLQPVSCKKGPSGELIYDFGQNFAGVIHAQIRGKAGQKVVFRHAEILRENGALNTALLRSAKATATYICAEGEQTYSPELTYMGFRYVSVEGIREEDLSLSAYALYSDVPENGSFACSNDLINKLQSNIRWSAKSNFVDIPTDCPQRDERMGWTGDIALFAPTACYNFDMSRFLEKWLNDVKNEQLKTGGIPNTVPVQGYGFPATMPTMAIDFWGDACLLVPYAEYMARGDKALLKKMYPTMKKYVDACRFWAGFGVGKRRYIWHTPAILHFGDWVAPDEPTMAGWQRRSKWTATASLCNTSGLLSHIAGLLGYTEDEKKYAKLSKKVASAYERVFTDGKGKMKKEFQTAYVLPLQFKMFAPENRDAAAKNLAELVKRNDYCVGTGFPGTPYVLFALADNGQAETAFSMLTNTKCPSWLYEVKAGGTTIWERWDALKEDGSNNFGAEDGTGGMVSFNHYAGGAVGDFLYKRVVGIEPLCGGYKTFSVKPLLGGGITWAKGKVETPYGVVSSEWKTEGNSFTLKIEVPVSTTCVVELPDGQKHTTGSGEYTYTCHL